jgi:hypothetical protein
MLPRSVVAVVSGVSANEKVHTYRADAYGIGRMLHSHHDRRRAYSWVVVV